ncbi:MAG: phage minor capsid protein [Chloroflexi bacterium]|nr:phage minor capsid protein [Chloroflexota bacterium]
MLTADQLDALTGPITDLYEQYNQSVINDISRRLAKMGKVTETAAWQMQRLIESGKVYENALKELAKTSGLSEVEMRKMFEAAGVKAMRFDDSIYKAAGLNPLPLNLSPAMAQVLAAGLRKTNGVVKNLTMTTAINAQHSFIQAADLAYMQVAGGAMSYDQAIRAAILNVAENGLHTINYTSGHKDKLDVAMRRTVLTGVSQTTGNLQIARADEMGTDLVQTSAHIGARPEHQLWQGWNCRHSFYPFFEGISENAYNQAELDSFANETVTYNGQEIPIYDATQQQRAIERKIRLWKRKEGALDAAGLDNDAETAKVKEWQSRMRDFIKQTGLQRQSVREIVGVGKNYSGVSVNSKAIGKVESLPQALGADVNKRALARAERHNELAKLSQEEIMQKIDALKIKNPIPEIDYHLNKHGGKLGISSTKEYQSRFEQHIQRDGLRYLTGIRQRDGARTWDVIDVETLQNSQYNEQERRFYTFFKFETKDDLDSYFEGTSDWLVEVYNVDGKWKLRHE